MIIRKKTKGNREYFYLEHSLRKGNKVVKKEKYLGRKIPKNIETIKEDFMKEIRLELYKRLEKIKENFQEEWKRIPESIKKKQKEEISISFTYNTNAIEGSKITLEETREIINNKIAPNKLLRDIKETEGHNKVFLEMLDKKEDITKELLLKWHKEIFQESKPDLAGKFRDYLVRVGPYLPPDWQEIGFLMRKLIKFINKESESRNPVELAGLVHYKFESIHPFGDGNGRVGRLLMNYILWHAGYPLLIIEYKKRNSYYRAFTKGEDGFLNYFLRRYLAIHKGRLKISSYKNQH
jgi:Fic family protein